MLGTEVSLSYTTRKQLVLSHLHRGHGPCCHLLSTTGPQVTSAMQAPCPEPAPSRTDLPGNSTHTGPTMGQHGVVVSPLFPQEAATLCSNFPSAQPSCAPFAGYDPS